MFPALTISEILSLIRTARQTYRKTDGHGYIDSACRIDQEYIYFMGTATTLTASFKFFFFFFEQT